jgi:hypothetical protein
MNFHFDEKTHTYYLDDKRLTGVTTILGVIAKPQLIGWAARMAVEAMVAGATPEEAKVAHTKKKEAAGEHGTDTHALVEQWVKACIESFNGKPVATKETDAITKFRDWAVEEVDHFLFSERRMYWGEPHWIAGTCDFAYVGKDGKRYIADFKTSTGIYGVDYFLQCAAYQALAENEGDAPYDACMIVRLGKDGAFETSRRETKEDEAAFWACLTLYRAQQSFTKANK